jgi:peptidoglycan/xylan/chitin deacetylase (PgdA/CDA1 family)
MLVSRGMFERHVDWLARRFDVIPPEEAASPRQHGSRPAAAITFDDGYRDVYEQAFPVLARKGLPAAVFVVSEFVGSSRILAHDRLYMLCCRAFDAWTSVPEELARRAARFDIALPPGPRIASAAEPLALLRALITTLSRSDLQGLCEVLEADLGPLECPDGLRPLTWDMVAEMSAAGITIGSHTRTHTLLSNEEPDTVRDETAGSRQQLESRIGRRVNTFAFPDGRFDAACVRAVAAAGYRVGFSTCAHRDPAHPWLTIPRLLLWERSSVDSRGGFSAAVLSCQASGLFALGSTCRQQHDR